MAANNANILSLNAATTNIPAGSYVQLSPATPIACSMIHIVNNTSSTVILGQGASGSEVGMIAVRPTDQVLLSPLSLNSLPAGARLALSALDTAATTGYVAVSLIP